MLCREAQPNMELNQVIDPTAEELASLDSQFTKEDWEESMQWLDEHNFKIVEK